MALTIADKIRTAVYTEDRALWLDPEDVDGIVADVVRVIGLDPEETLPVQVLIGDRD